MTKEIKKLIEQNIMYFSSTELRKAAGNLLNTLGYSSNKKANINLESLKTRAAERNIENLSYALWDEWKSADLVFQITGDEIKQESSLFDFNVVSEDLMQSYLFFAIELKGSSYSRGQFSGITRFMNRMYDMPVMVIFKYEGSLTFAIINRRPNKKETEKSVLEKITLIKDISIKSPHRAHIEILFDLSIDELQRKYGFSDFDGLHKAWQKTLDTKELNKQFYQKLFNWYLWAMLQVKFPQMRPKEEIIDDKVHQSESLIRLLTRLLFVWFMKEKRLINPDLFEQDKLKKILKNFTGEDGEETIYYKAILQNLFFATLNRPIDQRKPIDKRKTKNPEYGDPLVYRYEELYLKPENILKYFEDIPFLNGGLFDCLDQRRDADNPVEIRLDGFSTKKEKQPIIPDKLFFGEYNNIDLSTDYDDKKKNHLTVFGLIDILQQYKFTIEENTPVEEEVALDPELLGKVFENLLASYNPETQTTARKQTGSFYTPREIVNYMVDESLIAYLKNHVDDETRLRNLFSYEGYDGDNPFNKKETDTLLKAIDNCKILDPACGSGAFPMGVLQKMIHILHKLDPDNAKWFEMVISNFPAYMQPEVRKKLEKENWNYVRKLGIIQQCIYGVDIQPVATQIAKLRFFISLLVDQKEKSGEDNRGYEPLPNLDFKIVTANTLIPAPTSDEETTGLFAGQSDPFFEEFDKLTGLFFNTSNPEDKKELKNQIIRIIKKKCDQKIKVIESKYEHSDEKASKALKEKYRKFIEEKEREIKLWKSYPNLFKYESVDFFEPKYFFPKAKAGFDVVIGNPPYVRADSPSFAELRQIIMGSNYYLSLWEKWDLMVPFFERSLRMLGDNGINAFIASNSITTSKFAYKLQDWVLENYSVKSIDYFDDDMQIFEAGVVPIVSIILKTKKPQHSLKIYRKDEFDNIIKIQKVDLLNSVNLRERVFKKTFNKLFFTNIKTTNLGDICYLSKGMVINSDENQAKGEFVKNDLISDTNDKIHPKKYVEGKYIKRYEIEKIKYLEWGTERVPTQLSRQTFPGLYKGEKLFRGRVTEGTFDDTGILCNDSIVVFKLFIDLHDEKERSISVSISKNNINAKGSKTSLQVAKRRKELEAISQNFSIKYLLAVINSKYAIAYLNNFRKHRLENYFYPDDFRYYPIPMISSLDQIIFVFLVDIILILKDVGNDSIFIERLIDSMVYELYFPEEIKSAGCEVLKLLSNLPVLEKGRSNEKKIKVIEKVYKELSEPSHPVSIAMAKMQEIEEVKIIEGRV